ncbi:MAG TPA: FmdB family zinc ribbon protein [Candidatus Limnocylindrales bacterium]|nr:FmdB family zinc ribbon protein [Candidatus Limnocylindrales bacterium]
MPIYDYVCSNCKHRVEVIHGINASGPQVCPNCGQEGTMRRAFATPAIHFKGSGWAKKDRSSTSGASTKAAAKSSSGASDGAAGTDSGSSGPDPKAASDAKSSSASSSSED